MIVLRDLAPLPLTPGSVSSSCSPWMVRCPGRSPRGAASPCPCCPHVPVNVKGRGRLCLLCRALASRPKLYGQCRKGTLNSCCMPCHQVQQQVSPSCCHRAAVPGARRRACGGHLRSRCDAGSGRAHPYARPAAGTWWRRATGLQRALPRLVPYSSGLRYGRDTDSFIEMSCAES